MPGAVPIVEGGWTDKGGGVGVGMLGWEQGGGKRERDGDRRTREKRQTGSPSIPPFFSLPFHA